MNILIYCNNIGSLDQDLKELDIEESLEVSQKNGLREKQCVKMDCGSGQVEVRVLLAC